MARVLLVHGDPRVAKETAEDLTGLGHEVDWETVSHKAWRRIRVDPPDILVACLSPTGNPGLDAASATKSNRMKAIELIFYDVPDRLRDDVMREYPQATVTTRDGLEDALRGPVGAP